jgi:hypothetical protein
VFDKSIVSRTADAVQCRIGADNDFDRLA